MRSETSDMTTFVGEVLAPCMGDEPTAGAVVIVSDEAGSSYTTINMGPLEAAHVLRATADIIERRLGGNLEVMQ